MLTVAVMLPSGVGRGDCAFQVLENGLKLHMMVKWPEKIFDIKKMVTEGRTASGRPVTMCAAEIAALEDAVEKKFGPNINHAKSFATIALRFPVSWKCAVDFDFGEGETKMVCIDLIAVEQLREKNKDNI